MKVRTVARWSLMTLLFVAVILVSAVLLTQGP